MPSPPSSPRPNPIAALAALDALPPHLAQAALSHALPAANSALFPLLAQRWLALHSAPLHTPSPLLALPFRRLSTPPSSLSPANFAWQSIVLRWSDLPDPIRQAFHTQAAPSLQLAATQTLQSANISALLPFLVAAAEPPLRLLALDKFAKAFEADPQSLAALTRSAAADVDQPALAAAARGVIYHHSITPVEIALALADRRTLRTGGALATWLAAEAAVGAGSIRAAIRRSTDDSAWLRALELVPNPAWKSAALQKLSSSPNPIQFTELVSAGHLLENPHRAASLRSALRAKPIEAFLPSASRRLVGSGAIRWATLKPRLPEALSQRIALDALARLTATRLRAPLSPELKHEPETHPAVIQSQFLNLSPAGTLHECTRAASPRPPQSQPVPAPSPFEHWSREDSLLTSQDGTLARIRWRRMIENDRDHALRELRAACERVPLSGVVSQVTLLRRLEVVPELVGWLAALALKPITDNHRAVATAVAALGDADGAAIRKLLSSLTTHSDARIRANAIESLGRLIRRGDRDAVRLIELKPDPNHRVRANAIRSLWFEEPRCGDALLDMLSDDRLAHRIAIAWSCRRLPLSPSHAAALRRHLSSEHEPRIRELLADALAHTDRHRRLSWRSNMPEPTPKLFTPRLAVA